MEASVRIVAQRRLQASSAASPNAMTQTGMKENVAGLLCYVLGWMTGLIFFFVDKRSFVRFHAKQLLCSICCISPVWSSGSFA